MQYLMALGELALRALLLGAIGAMAAFLARRRGAELQHAIWSVVLAGMLALPILTATLPRIPLRSTPIVSTAIPRQLATAATTRLAIPTISPAPAIAPQ